MSVYSHYSDCSKYYGRWLLWMASIRMWGCQHSYNRWWLRRRVL